MMNAGIVFCDRHFWGINCPKGGVGRIAQALADGIKEQGSGIMYRANVREILTEGEGDKLKAVGVQLADDSVFHGQTVISNATRWDTFKYLMEQQALPKSEQLCRKRYKNNPSFIFTHMGVKADVLPQGAQCHHIIVEIWQKMQDPHETLLAEMTEAGFTGTATGVPDDNAAGVKAATQGGRKKNRNRKKAAKAQDPQARPSGSPVLEVGAGAASSSSLTVIPHDTPSVVPSSLSASAAAAGSDGVKASSSGGAAASGIGDDKKSVLGLHEKMRRHTAARRKDSAQVPVPTAMMKGLLADSTSKAMAASGMAEADEEGGVE
ncbi:hypothetical protein WJX79_006071 [Trebouxia sp. C0005]